MSNEELSKMCDKAKTDLHWSNAEYKVKQDKYAEERKKIFEPIIEDSKKIVELMYKEPHDKFLDDFGDALGEKWNSFIDKVFEDVKGLMPGKYSRSFSYSMADSVKTEFIVEFEILEDGTKRVLQ